MIETAPAKINLYLHIGPTRADGLHALTSLFAFARAGDRIRVEPAADLSLEVVGPFASALEGLAPQDNIVFKAARALRALGAPNLGAKITLEKNLPVAAGVGGGSADAAAALRALNALWEIDASRNTLRTIAFRLGADVPACLDAAPIYVSGAGEVIEKGPRAPRLWVVLANPGIAMPTGRVFSAFDARNPRPEAPSTPRLEDPSVAGVAKLMASSRNDLEPIAVSRAPIIGSVVSLLAAQPGAVAARMSGSGATAFGLYSSQEAAERAARRARAQDWWASASALERGDV
ncbi:MAG: 4-(cytidine 5'-diphospho)-2-C-methyl-D-erythritol kinase [Pseudomonadota bacterium]